MAIDLNLSDIGSGFNRSVINDNFAAIQEAMEDAVSRSGVTPNQIQADLDLDGNDLLNVGTVSVEELTVQGTTFVPEGVTAVGPPGDDATVTVGTVTTGAAGTNVIITNVGTANDAILNFTIPRGDQGASGAGTGDMLAAQNLNDVANKVTAFTNIKQAATTSATGVVELATNAEALTGTDTTRAITPANLDFVLDSRGIAASITEFSSSGTWNKPSSGSIAYIQVWGAGGSGGTGTAGSRAGGGGGGGGYNELTVKLADLASSYSVTVGTGGAAVSSSSFLGLDGGSSSFGTLISAFGGAGGGAQSSGTIGGGGGGGGGTTSVGTKFSAATGGVGGTGFFSRTTGDEVGGAGGSGASGGAGSGTSAPWGGGGGGGGAGDGSGTAQGGAGGQSRYGGGGGAGGSNSSASANVGGVSLAGGNGGIGGIGSGNATAGTAPGGGGGGARGGTSGAGANGLVRVTVW